jgi:hypothetical protein
MITGMVMTHDDASSIIGRIACARAMTPISWESVITCHHLVGRHSVAAG